MEVATVSFLGDAKRFLGDAKSSLGDAESCPLAMSLRRSLCSLCSSPSTTQETVASLSKEAAAAETSRRELVGMRQMAAATEVEASRERKKREAHVAEARAAEATAASALQRERSASAAEVETLRRERVSMREKLDALSARARAGGASRRRCLRGGDCDRDASHGTNEWCGERGERTTRAGEHTRDRRGVGERAGGATGADHGEARGARGGGGGGEGGAGEATHREQRGGGERKTGAGEHAGDRQGDGEAGGEAGGEVTHTSLA
jgi:hypothetical protein